MELYTIKRFYRSGRKSIIATGQLLEEAQEHCKREDTHKYDADGVIWFDGYVRE